MNTRNLKSLTHAKLSSYSTSKETPTCLDNLLLVRLSLCPILSHQTIRTINKTILEMMFIMTGIVNETLSIYVRDHVYIIVLPSASHNPCAASGLNQYWVHCTKRNPTTTHHGSISHLTTIYKQFKS
jgi:hypothetical protein